jgi:hypothetical protein
MTENAVTVKKNEVSVVSHEPVSAIERMLAGGVKPEDLEKFLAVQERYEQNEAKKAYVAAMAAFKADPPTIMKDKTVSYKETKYNHASLGNVTRTINAGLGQYGLSASWRTEQGDKGLITVTCTITHALGYSESTSLSASPDVSGSKNSIQAIGSTISYLQRYTILALTGLATEEQDDDGGFGGAEFVTPEQVETINRLVKESNAKLKPFLAFAGAETVDTILASNFNKVVRELNRKIAAMKKPEREPGSDDE